MMPPGVMRHRTRQSSFIRTPSSSNQQWNSACRAPVPSSDKKAQAPSAIVAQIRRIVGALEAKCNILSAENAEVTSALVTASQQITEHRTFVAQLRRSKEEQEWKSSMHIQNLEANIEGRDQHVEYMQQVITEQQDMITSLESTIKNMAGEGFEILYGDEATEALQSIQP